ncbi:hypothetical protein Thini_2138 [Thiothrix nivea DSM 5205]|uniref:Uncharacterized protein n=1 Tax=Thiothrix nivea (strain ATCC 35100 / DSM 5205 / JP2) TaxID=870187 RepID=A0A656HI52_THINJ|nr:hypothetical protein Thini_2138 [Thiothrix nivea DSM 5205]
MPRWTPESRKQQSQLIKQTQPWLESTGAKTVEGKAKSSKNATKHGARSRKNAWFFRELEKEKRKLKEIETMLRGKIGEEGYDALSQIGLEPRDIMTIKLNKLLDTEVPISTHAENSIARFLEKK